MVSMDFWVTGSDLWEVIVGLISDGSAFVGVNNEAAF